MNGRRICSGAVIALAIAWLLALALLAVGTFGLLGQPRDPLAGVFLMPLGLPWNLLADRALGLASPWVAALAPALNIALLAWICRRRR